ncbi:MAG: hypothetical protein QNJ45_23305 [Ardenticatenaceae bacterium]|nr:hypothetical protein [Ardenticatenaceae bacterium]
MRYFWTLFLLFLVACGGQTATSPPLVTKIVCHTAYRSSVSQPIEREESLIFAEDNQQEIVSLNMSVSFDDMIFHGDYRSGAADNERSLQVWVTDIDDTTRFQNHLYQLELDSGPVNQFVGGHGFTGLNYSYHPQSGAELQYWCEAG